MLEHPTLAPHTFSQITGSTQPTSSVARKQKHCNSVHGEQEPQGQRSFIHSVFRPFTPYFLPQML